MSAFKRRLSFDSRIKYSRSFQKTLKAQSLKSSKPGSRSTEVTIVQPYVPPTPPPQPQHVQLVPLVYVPRKEVSVIYEVDETQSVNNYNNHDPPYDSTVDVEPWKYLATSLPKSYSELYREKRELSRVRSSDVIRRPRTKTDRRGARSVTPGAHYYVDSPMFKKVNSSGPIISLRQFQIGEGIGVKREKSGMTTPKPGEEAAHRPSSRMVAHSANRSLSRTRSQLSPIKSLDRISETSSSPVTTTKNEKIIVVPPSTTLVKSGSLPKIEYQKSQGGKKLSQMDNLRKAQSKAFVPYYDEVKINFF